MLDWGSGHHGIKPILRPFRGRDTGSSPVSSIFQAPIVQSGQRHRLLMAKAWVQIPVGASVQVV